MKIEINGKGYDFENGQTILKVASKNKIKIPTLCYLEDICDESNCRICVVELEGGKLVTACSTKATDGMKIQTDSEKVIQSRKDTLKMLLSVHHKDCEHCQKNGECALQELFDAYEISENNNDFVKPEYEIDDSSPAIVRNNNKCILCSRCQKVCSNTQAVHALTKQKRGFNTFMGCAFNTGLKESTCVGCGQCTLVCPTGALMEKSEAEDVLKLLENKGKSFITAQVAPSVRVSLAEAFNQPLGTFDEGKMVAALKKLGFDKVFDINLGADFTVVEESNELLERIKENKDLPVFSSCCPAWFKYVQNFYPEHTNYLSSCKSPTEMLGAIIKNYYAEKEKLNKDNIKVVGIMPCTAKKGEKLRGKDVDIVITTRELAKIIKAKNIDFNNLKPVEFDSPLSHYTGAALIFGATGGVTEAALRTVVSKLDPNSKQVDFTDVRKSEGRKEVTLKVAGLELNVCVVNGLANAKKVMDDIICGRKKYHFVEVMACPGGCVNGGGQTFVDYKKTPINVVKAARADSLYKKDKELPDRLSHTNLSMKEVYDNFFIPSPNKAHELLHYRHKK